MHKKQIKRRGHDDRLDDDLAGIEPILDFAAIEHELKRADGETQRAEAEPIQLLAGVALGVRQKNHHAEQRNNADRQIDVEDIAPAVVLGQPAAENRTEHRADHDPDPEQRHGETLPLARIGAEQNGLRERHQRRAERALQHPEHHDFRQ